MAVKTFTTGEVLTASDTNTYLANSGLVYVTKATLSGTSTQINNCFTSTYAAYRLVFTSLTFSTESLMTLRLVASSTPNQNNSYYASGLQVTPGGTVTGIGSGPATYWHTAISASPTAGGTFLDIYNPQLTAGTAFDGMGVDTRTNGAPMRITGGFFDATTSFDGIWISTLNGGYTLGGTVTIYGYRVG